jgi:L-asparagine transporter-like permease
MHYITEYFALYSDPEVHKFLFIHFYAFILYLAMHFGKKTKSSAKCYGVNHPISHFSLFACIMFIWAVAAGMFMAKIMMCFYAACGFIFAGITKYQSKKFWRFRRFETKSLN